MKDIYRQIGILVYPILLPIMRPILKRTKRVYGAIIYEGEVLLVKNWLAPDTWRLPGGGVRKGEQAVDALARELHEELGVYVEPEMFTHLVSSVLRTDSLGFSYDIYYAEVKARPAITQSRLEIVDVTLASVPPEGTQEETTEAVNMLIARRLL